MESHGCSNFLGNQQQFNRQPIHLSFDNTLITILLFWISRKYSSKILDWSKQNSDERSFVSLIEVTKNSTRLQILAWK